MQQTGEVDGHPGVVEIQIRLRSFQQLGKMFPVQGQGFRGLVIVLQLRLENVQGQGFVKWSPGVRNGDTGKRRRSVTVSCIHGQKRSLRIKEGCSLNLVERQR